MTTERNTSYVNCGNTVLSNEKKIVIGRSNVLPTKRLPEELLYSMIQSKTKTRAMENERNTILKPEESAEYNGQIW